MSQSSASIQSGRPQTYLALVFPFLPTDRLMRNMAAQAGNGRDELARAHSTQSNPPHVVFANDRGALRLTAANAVALATGLAPGMTLADARARTPALLAAEANPAADAQLLRHVALWCLRYTPLVAVAPQGLTPHGVALDVSGSSHLFGGVAALAAAASAALRRQGLHVVAAGARTPSMARALAVAGIKGVLPPEREAEVLGALPLGVLELPEDKARLLERLGLKTLGALAAQPRAPLAARAGRGALERLDAVLGHVEEPFHSLVALPDCLAERAFAHPVTEEAALLKTLGRLAADLGEVLERRGEGARCYEALAFRSDGAVRRLTVETGRPTRDPAIVERLFRERLANLADPLDPGFGFDLIRLAVTRTERFDHEMHGQGVQGFGADGAAEAAEALVIDQLTVKLGPGAVTRALPVNTHWPERAVEHLPAQQIAAPEADWPVLRGPGEPPARPIRLFDPPEPVEALAEVPDGPPARFRWRRVLHDVARAEGPERLAPEWWRDGTQSRTRDYFRVEDREGHRFWLFREGLYGFERQAPGVNGVGEAPPRWFLHGVFA